MNTGYIIALVSKLTKKEFKKLEKEFEQNNWINHSHGNFVKVIADLEKADEHIEILKTFSSKKPIFTITLDEKTFSNQSQIFCETK